MPVLKNVSPLGHVDVPLIGREGGPMAYYECPDGTLCVAKNGPDHEHELVKAPPEASGTGCLEPGEEFEVSDEHAKALLEHPDNFAPVADAMDVMTVDELKELAQERAIDLTGLTKKADIVAAIKKDQD